MKKFIIIVSIIILIPLLALLTIYAAMGGVPVVSSIIGADKPKDLGVRYTKADYDDLVAKLKIKVYPAPTSGRAVDYKKVYKGTKKIDMEYTDEVFTSILNINKPSYLMVSKTQVKFHKDGTMEASAMVNTDYVKDYIKLLTKGSEGKDLGLAANVGIKFLNTLPQKVPVYAAGKVEYIGNNHIHFDVKTVKVGVLPTPANLLSTGNIEYANKVANDALDTMTGLKIEKLSFEEGKLNFKGTVPAGTERILINK